MSNYKKCTVCQQIKHIDEFYSKTGKFRTSQCKKCHNKGMRAYQKTGKGKLRLRKSRLKYEYGITEEQYRDYMDRQKGVCPICLKSLDWSKGIICVDHDHATGGVRGLLCDMCNKMIGCSYDSPDILRSAANYLEPKGLI